MNYIKVKNPINKEECYLISNLNERLYVHLLDKIFDCGFKVISSDEDELVRIKKNNSFAYTYWEFNSGFIDEDKFKRMVDELEYNDQKKLTYGKK